MNLDEYLKLAATRQQCQICTFSDKYEEMIEVDRDGEKATVHRECLELEQSKHYEKLSI